MGITYLVQVEKDIEGRDHHSISEIEMNLLQAKTGQNTVSQTKQNPDTALSLGEAWSSGIC